MTEIYVLIKFRLNEGINISEWKKISNNINKDITGVNGFQFRDSGVDEKGNIHCIIKWDSLEQQEIFKAKKDKKIAENPEMMKEISRIADMKTMTMDKITLI